MALKPGARLGPYEIVGAIGAGGMGEVYKARDTRLDRLVALKVLPAQFAHDPQFRERFEREAKSVSKLSHPHICALHDIGTTSAAAARGLDYIVLEYLDGETLATRLGRGALPVKEAVRIGSEIASALENAHRQGIVHRDLKPGNIMLTKSGAKLLDFGLAKLATTAAVVSASAGSIPTEIATITTQGTILGTFQYMAPEQVEGREADARSDIFALGAVLYEMFTGRTAFHGQSQASLLGAILKEDPPQVSQTRTVSPALDHLVQMCLAKDPDERIQTAHDVWLQLKWAADSSAASVTATKPQARYRSAIAAAGILSALALVSALTWWLKPAPPERRIATRFQYILPPNQQYSAIGRHVVALSPDGTKLAYVANRQLFLRELNQLDAQPLHGTADPTTSQEPIFSPDGQWIAYFALRSNPVAGVQQVYDVKRVAVSGGAPVTLGSIGGPPFGATWQNGLIVVGRAADGIEAIPEMGGTPRTLVTVDARTERAVQPHLMGDGRHVLFTVASTLAIGRETATGEGPIVIQPLDGGPRKVIVNLGGNPQLLPTGHLVYVHDRTLFAVRFDSRRLEVAGTPVPIVEGVGQVGASGAAQYAISRAGVLAYLPPAFVSSRQLVWVDRDAREQAVAAPFGSYQQPRLSPDGTRMVVSVGANLSILTLATDTLVRLTNDGAAQYNPIWTPDGKRIIYDSNDGTGVRILRRSADGTGSAEVVSTDSGFPNVVTADGRMLIYHSVARVAMVLPLESGGRSRPLLPDVGAQTSDVEISPNGRWMAYESNESGRFEVKVRPFPGATDGQWQISSGGGHHPLWSRDGGQLFFIAADGMMMAVPVQTGPTFTHGRAVPLFPAGHYHVNVARNYEVSPDGKRFLMVKAAAVPPRSSMVIVTDWFAEVLEKMKGH